MNAVPDYGNVVAALPNRKPGNSAREESSSERSFSSFLDDQRGQSGEVQSSNDVKSNEKEDHTTFPSPDTTQADVDKKLEEDRAAAALRADYLLLANSEVVVNVEGTNAEVTYSSVTAVDELASPDADSEHDSSGNDQLLSIGSEQPVILGSKGGDSSFVGTLETVDPSQPDSGDGSLEVDSNAELGSTASPDEVHGDIRQAALESNALDKATSQTKSSLDSSTQSAARTSSETLAASGSASNSNRLTSDDLEDELQLETAVAEGTNTATVSSDLETSLGGNDRGESDQHFDSQTPILEFTQANQTPVNPDNIQSQSPFINSLQEVAQRSSPVEPTASLPDLSAPTSQLKVAIVANAASIEAEANSTIQVDLHPAELGRLQVRIEQTGDQLHAKIIATEIASSELLLQDRQHLVEALNELGFGETSLDITHQESNDPRDNEQVFNEELSQGQPTEEKQQSDSATYLGNNSVGINFVA